jgi:heptosyltransferase-1
MGSVRRVLIIKLSAFGDIIHALPVAQALRSSFPHIDVTWAIEETFAPLLAGNTTINHILTLPKVRGKQLRSPSFHRDYFRGLRDVRRRRFDLTLDLQGLTKSAVVAAASGAPLRLAYHYLREAASFFERPIPREPGSVHVVDQYLDVARFLGARVDRPEFPFDIPVEDDEAAAGMLAECGVDPGAPFVAVNPATAHAVKQWGAAHYARLLDKLHDRYGRPGVMVTADRGVAAKVEELVTKPVANLAGRTNLKQLAAVLRRSAVHVCGDTGSGHLAAALSRPVIAIVGPTNADRSCPYGQRANVIRHVEQCSAACNWHHCQFTPPRCLESITPDEVAEKVIRVMSLRPSE